MCDCGARLTAARSASTGEVLFDGGMDSAHLILVFMRGDKHKGRAAAFQADDRGVRLSLPAPITFQEHVQICRRF